MTPKDLEDYVGQPFVRISPITGGLAHGIVRWISVVGQFSPGLDKMVSFHLHVTSTNGNSYDLSECRFASNVRPIGDLKLPLKSVFPLDTHEPT